jgi:hypothetical protein
MAAYVLIETRASPESPQVKDFLALAASLVDRGQLVDLFLAQNAVLMAYPERESLVEQLLDRPGVTVWADDFSLESRAYPAPLLPGVRVGGADTLVQLLARPDCKPIWH